MWKEVFWLMYLKLFTLAQNNFYYNIYTRQLFSTYYHYCSHLFYEFLQNQNVLQLCFGLTFGLCIVSAIAS